MLERAPTPHRSRLSRAVQAERQRDVARAQAVAPERRRALGGFAHIPLLSEGTEAGTPIVPFDPNSIPGLLAWYNSENIFVVTVMGVDYADGCLDLTGNARNGTADSAGQRPVVYYANPQFNMAPSLTWSNANNTCIRTPALTFGAWTVVLVARITTASTYLAATNGLDYIYNNLGFSFYSQTRGGTGPSAYNHPVGAGWATGTAPKTYSIRMDGTHVGHTVRINGVTQTLTDIVSTDPGTTPLSSDVSIMSYITGTTSSSGEMGAFFFFDNAISDVNLDKLELKMRGYYQHY